MPCRTSLRSTESSLARKVVSRLTSFLPGVKTCGFYEDDDICDRYKLPPGAPTVLTMFAKDTFHATQLSRHEIPGVD